MHVCYCSVFAIAFAYHSAVYQMANIPSSHRYVHQFSWIVGLLNQFFGDRTVRGLQYQNLPVTAINQFVHIQDMHGRVMLLVTCY